MRYIVVAVILLFMSCDSGYLVRYSVAGTATEATITYLDNGNNIESVEILPFTKDIFVSRGTPIGLNVKNPIDGNIEARILFIHNGDWQFYKKSASDSEVNIKDTINSLL